MMLIQHAKELQNPCCVCTVLHASYFLRLVLQTLHLLLIFRPEGYRSSAKPPYSIVNHGVALLNALLEGITTAFAEIGESNTHSVSHPSVQRNQYIGPTAANIGPNSE